MSQFTRRRLVGSAVGSAALAGAMAIGSAPVAGAAPKTGLTPAVISAQDKPIEITFAHIWGTPQGEAPAATKHPAELVIEAFNAQSTTVKVTSRTDPGGYYTNLQKAQAELAAGKPPAMVITPWSNINYASEGLGIIDLEDIAGDEVDSVFSNFKDQVIPLVQIEGKTKGLPYAFSCPTVYYNADILKEAGVDPDVLFETWASFLQEAPKVQAVLDGNPVMGFLGDRQWLAQSIIQSNGGRVLNDDGEPAVDSAEAIAAMQAIADIDSAGLYDSSTGAETQASFLGGSTAVFIGSVASLGGLRKNATFDLQTSLFPTFEDHPRKMSSGGCFIGVYAHDEAQQKAAWEFLKFAASEEGYAIWMKTGYLNASNYELPTLEGQEPAYQQLSEGLTPETPWPSARGGEIQGVWASYCERIWANDIGAEEGCKEAAKEMNAIRG